jgi:hypothetical protein
VRSKLYMSCKENKLIFFEAGYQFILEIPEEARNINISKEGNFNYLAIKNHTNGKFLS